MSCRLQPGVYFVNQFEFDRVRRTACVMSLRRVGLQEGAMHSIQGFEQ